MCETCSRWRPSLFHFAEGNKQLIFAFASSRSRGFWLGAAALSAAIGFLAGPVLAANFPTKTSAISSVAGYQQQKVSWNSCGTDMYCGTVKVPEDWNNLKGKSISLAVIYHRASAAKPLGSVIFNPGGPGASGFDFIRDSMTAVGTDNLRANYNFVGFDPRGVQNSTPKIKCLTAASMDKLLYGDSGFALGSAKDLAYTRAQEKTLADSCAKNTGSMLAHVDTISTAKDLDILRSVMGDSKLNYLGYSYGTLIGATYASLFPSKVGRMVLDGAIDPTISNDVQSLIQLKGFDLALNDYLDYCLGKSGCPFSGSVTEARTKISAFLRGLETEPIKSTDYNRTVSVWAANQGISMALYSGSYWPYLTQALTSAFKGDGTTLLRLADMYNDRDANGTYISNQTEAFIATSCLDGASSWKMSDMLAQNKRMVAASSVFGRYWQFGGLACQYWHYKPVKPLASYAAKGSPTIVVVGTTGDPATPYTQAVALAHKVLSNGYLITWKGEGHTAYGRSNSCINTAVDNFFVQGILAATEPTC